jgi:hypothetical protein
MKKILKIDAKELLRKYISDYNAMHRLIFGYYSNYWINENKYFYVRPSCPNRAYSNQWISSYSPTEFRNEISAHHIYQIYWAYTSEVIYFLENFVIDSISNKGLRI